MTPEEVLQNIKAGFFEYSEKEVFDTPNQTGQRHRSLTVGPAWIQTSAFTVHADGVERAGFVNNENRTVFFLTEDIPFVPGNKAASA